MDHPVFIPGSGNTGADVGHEQDPQKERAVSEGLDPERMPRHIAFIMDGNGRWAEGKGLTRAEGHSVGVESVREIIRCAGEFGIGILTFFGFSTENWKRPKREVAAIMRLIVESLRGAIDEVTAQDIRVSPTAECRAELRRQAGNR